MPQFATYEALFSDFDGAQAAGTADTCWIVNYRTDYIVWKKNAFRDCVFDGYTAASAAP